MLTLVLNSTFTTSFTVACCGIEFVAHLTWYTQHQIKKLESRGIEIVVLPFPVVVICCLCRYYSCILSCAVLSFAFFNVHTVYRQCRRDNACSWQLLECQGLEIASNSITFYLESCNCITALWPFAHFYIAPVFSFQVNLECSRLLRQNFRLCNAHCSDFWYNYMSKCYRICRTKIETIPSNQTANDIDIIGYKYPSMWTWHFYKVTCRFYRDLELATGYWFPLIQPINI